MSEDFVSTIKEILKYGGSTFAALIVMSVYTTTDGLFIGNFIGTNGLAAMALIYPVTIIFIAIGTLFETGGSAVVASVIGENKKDTAEKIMRTNYFTAIIVGIIIAVVGNIFVEDFLKFLSDNPEEFLIIDLAVSYLRITLCSVTFSIMIYMTGAFMRCIGQPSHVAYLMCTTVVINIILDALFIIVFGWGMEGAAGATFIAQFSGAVITFYYFKFSKHKFSTKFSIGDFEYIFQEIKIGAGFGFASLMLFVTEYFLNFILLQYDAAHLLSVAAISNIILSFVFLPLNGLDTGIQPLMSKLFAEKKENEYLNVMRYGFFTTMILTVGMYIILMIFPEELARFFIESNEPITEDMVIFLQMLFLFQPFVGIYTWLSGIMAALEDEWRNIVVGLSPIFVQVPLMWFMPKFIPIEYVALAFSLQDVAEASIAFLLIHSFFKMKGISFKKIFKPR
ncbi:MAG: MATE family efflux transporter [Selenomonadaceae bacterium]|nr:MATE family efflux transporter [Selenomonadaceae bacterium]